MKKVLQSIISFLIICSIISFVFIYIIIYNTGLNNLVEYKYKNFSNMELNDCILIDNNKLEVIGDDPYVVIHGLYTPIKNIEINLSQEKEYIKRLSIYYDTGKQFNENERKSIAIKQNENNIILGINKKINSIRLDFEDINFGERKNQTINIKYLWINPKADIKFPISIWLYNICFFLFIKILIDTIKVKNFYLIIVPTFVIVYLYDFIVLKYQSLILILGISFISLIIFINLFYLEEN